MEGIKTASLLQINFGSVFREVRDVKLWCLQYIPSGLTGCNLVIGSVIGIMNASC